MNLSAEQLKALSQNSDKIISNKEILKKFIQNFPFKDLLDHNAMHSDFSLYCLSILRDIASQSELYEYPESTKSIMEYAVVIITTLSSFCDMHILSRSLDLMRILVKKLFLLPDLRNELLNIERIFEVLIIASGSQAFNTSSANVSAEILEILLRIQPVLTDSSHRIIEVMFSKCRYLGGISGICILATHILRRFDSLSTCFMPIYNWIVEESCKYLKSFSDPQVLHRLLRCLNHFIDKYSQVNHIEGYVKCYRKLFLKLRAVSSVICRFISSNELRSQALNLFKFILLDFCKDSDISVDEVISLLKLETGKLKHNPNRWPYTRNKLFFLICVLLYSNDKLLWSNKEIMDAIEIQLRVPETFSFVVFKPLFFMYSITVVENLHPRRVLVGDNLLRMLYIFSGCRQIYTFHAAQLVWILSRATSDFKINALKQWLRNVQEDNEIISIVKYCKAGRVLIRILKQRSEEMIMERTSKLVRKLEDNELYNEVASLLPLAVSYPILLKYLIIAHPAVPQDKNEGIKLCSFLGSVLTRVDDEEVLRGILSYSKRLLASLAYEPAGIREFCKRKTNILFILELTFRVKENTVLEIIRLLQLFISIQESANLSITTSVEADLSHLLTGSRKKIIKATQLFRQILSIEHTFIRFDFESYKNLFHHLLFLSNDKMLNNNIYECLSLSIKREPRLALMPMAYMHIDTYCQVPLDKKFARIYLQYLFVWIQAVENQNWRHVMVSIKTVKKFVLSFSTITNLKKQKYLELLDRIPTNPLWV